MNKRALYSAFRARNAELGLDESYIWGLITIVFLGVMITIGWIMVG